VTLQDLIQMMIQMMMTQKKNHNMAYPSSNNKQTNN